MKLIVGIVNKDGATSLLNILVTAGYHVTTSQTAGGFLRTENVTLMTGVQDDQVETVVRLIQDNCHKRTQSVSALPLSLESGTSYILEETKEVEVGGAVIFVLDVTQFHKA